VTTKQRLLATQTLRAIDSRNLNSSVFIEMPSST
jgi:hypothetical protein